MITDLLFSLGIVMPLFILLLLGFALRRIDFINDTFTKTGNKLMFYIGLPVIIFRSIYNADIREVFDLRFVLAMLGITLTTGLLIWLIAIPLIKEKPMRGAFISSAFRGNQAFLGIPLMMSLAGDAGLLRATMVVTFVLPFSNVLSIFVMAFNGRTDKKINPFFIFMTIIKNPVIIMTAVGLLLAFLDFRLPAVGEVTMDYLAQMATPLALLCIGASLHFEGFDKKFNYALFASLIKIVVLPIAFAGIGFLLGFRGYDLAAMAIMGGVPSAIAGYAMVVEMGGDGYIASTIIIMSTLLSSFTLTFIIYLIRVMGIAG